MFSVTTWYTLGMNQIRIIEAQEIEPGMEICLWGQWTIVEDVLVKPTGHGNRVKITDIYGSETFLQAERWLKIAN